MIMGQGALHECSGCQTLGGDELYVLKQSLFSLVQIV